jgi:hypothetical protein
MQPGVAMEDPAASGQKAGTRRAASSCYKIGTDVRRPFTRFLGIDLGGARGKTTAVADLTVRGGGIWVQEVATRRNGEPWRDDTLWEYLSSQSRDTVIAIGAPLTQPACGRCVRPACPGVAACEDPAVIWLRTEGQALAEDAVAESMAAPATVVHTHTSHTRRLLPYSHRATEVVLCYEQELVPVSALGAANGLVAARAVQLRRRLAGAGFELNTNLIEVSPAATVASLFDRRRARGYKRDADAWQTRAAIVEHLGDLAFAPSSRLSREEVLRNDHCFDALIAGYTGYLWAREGWTLPEPADVFRDDGWVWTPPLRHR